MSKPKPHPKSPRRTNTARALPRAERASEKPTFGDVKIGKWVKTADVLAYVERHLPNAGKPAAPTLPTADAALLEKLDTVRTLGSELDAAITMADCTDAALKLATDRRTSAYDKRAAARRALTAAETALAAQLATRPGQPIRYNGATYVHVAGAGLQKFTGLPLVLGVQS